MAFLYLESWWFKKKEKVNLVGLKTTFDKDNLQSLGVKDLVGSWQNIQLPALKS